MNRRSLLKGTGAAAAMLALHRSAHAAQYSIAPPVSHAPEDQPVDKRARELVSRLHDLSPLAVLDALESGEVREPFLHAAAHGASPHALPWNDPLDTDLEHALVGVLIATNEEPRNSPDLQTLGGYIVFESPEIAYDQFVRHFNGAESSMMSMSVAGTKAWILLGDGMQLAVMRLGYVLIMAETSDMYGNTAEGIIMHLDTITRGLT